MSDAIEIRGLTVRYGDTTVLETIDFVVGEGTVTGLLGRNGTGKSSLLRCALGQQMATAEVVTLLGRPMPEGRADAMPLVGVVPEDGQAPPHLSAVDLDRLGRNVYPTWDSGGFRDRLGRGGVPLDRPCGRLSKGQRKQLELAFALAHRPRLLVLDDPSLGLDPVARTVVFDEVIRTLADEGITVLLATHDLAAVTSLADRVALLRDGRIAVDEPVDELRARHRRLVARGDDELGLDSDDVVRRRRPWGHEIVARRWSSELAARIPDHVEVHSMSLEEIFEVESGADLEEIS